MEIMVKDYQMISHMAAEKMHSSMHVGTLVCDGSPLNGLIFRHETHTPKKNGEFGTATNYFYLFDDSTQGKKTKYFRKLKELIEFYSEKK